MQLLQPRLAAQRAIVQDVNQLGELLGQALDSGVRIAAVPLEPPLFTEGIDA